MRLRDKLYYVRNKTRITTYQIEYYFANKSMISKQKVNYRKRNPEVHRAIYHRRMAKKRCLPDFLSAQRLSESFAFFGNVCPFTKSTKTEVEHFIPISWGHGGSYLGNIYPMDSNLNSSKRNCNPFYWSKKRPNISKETFDHLVDYLALLNGLTSGEFRSYVDWCDANRRTVALINADNLRYGYTVSSVELWRAATGLSFPLRIDFRDRTVSSETGNHSVA